DVIQRGNVLSPGPKVSVSRVLDARSPATICVVPVPKISPPLQTCSGSPAQNAMRVPSGPQCGVPAISVDALIRRRPEPSGCTMYTPRYWGVTNGAGPGKVVLGQEVRVASRSEENAIHLPSGDHDGRKSPAGWRVMSRSLRVVRSRSQISACLFRVETKASDFPSGERLP